MSIFEYVLLAIWGAAYLALFVRRANRRHRVRISGPIPRPDLDAIPLTFDVPSHAHHGHHHVSVFDHVDIGHHH